MSHTFGKRNHDEADVPPIDELLVSLDIASRDSRTETENVIAALLLRSPLDGVPARDYIGLALLVAFRRRNHERSQTAGVGSGERHLLRTVLAALAAHGHSDEVKLVLPLVPLYGSWRDLLVLGESMIESLLPDDGSVADLPVVDAICSLWATQLAKDRDDSSTLPSNACKYAPHEQRHKSARKHKSGTMDASAKSTLLADAIARKLGLASGHDSDNKHALRAAYRRLRAALNARLTDAGHLLEPLMATRRLEAISFTKAPKTALAKNKKALLKDPRTAERWTRAMATSSKAVPDVDDLPMAASDAIAEAGEPNATLRLMPKRLAKALDTMAAQRAELFAKVASLIGQLKESPAAAADATDDSPVSRAMAALSAAAHHPALPLVLSSAAGSSPSAPSHELLLAAFLAALAQDLSHVAVDGCLVTVVDDDAEEVAPAPAAEAEAASTAAAAEATAVAMATKAVPRAPDFDAFVARARLALATRGEPPADDLTRLYDGARALLATHAAHAADGSAAPADGAAAPARGADVLVLTSAFGASAEPEKLNDTVALLKADGMRTLLVHRLRAPLASAGVPSANDIAFTPRAGLRPIPARGSETIDVCFMLDLTGSMGPWIHQCRQHVAGIIHALRDELAVSSVRVAFVGYRDWAERGSGRVVTVNFVPLAEVDAVITALSREQASGGGDAPEDVISAFEAATALSWRGDVRVAVFIADAPAHGWMGGARHDDGLGCGSDDFPSGMCPDQSTPLPDLVTELASTHGVDLLCTKLNASTERMQRMFADRYKALDATGAGFGALSLTRGASCFKAAILGSLTSALVQLIAPSVESPGVQTFDGQTLSALMATLHASLRESIDAAAGTLHAPSARACASAEAERSGIIAAAEARVTALEAEAAATAADAVDIDDDAPTHAETELAAARAALERVRDAPTSEHRAARSDAERLRASLMSDELAPVRLALGLPLPSASLAREAAMALLKAGVCVAEMNDKGYPESFITAMREAGAELAKRA